MGDTKLAINGGDKAIEQLGSYPTKIGSEELVEIVDMRDFSDGTKEKIIELIKNDSSLQGPHLFRYYNPVNIPFF